MSKNIENKLIPKLRFPEFSKDGEWQLTSIGQVGKFYYGKSAPKWSLSEDAPTPCVRYGELYTKFDTIIDKVYSRTNIEPSNLKFSKGGEILVPRVGEVPQDFAKNCCYLPFPNIAIGEMISVYETKEHPIFYTHYFRTLFRQFAKVVEGQNVKNLYYINLEPIKIGKPSYLEQKKISDCLSSLDEIIKAESQKLDLLQNHKRGLLQNLLPNGKETKPKYRFKEFEKSSEWVEETLINLANFRRGSFPQPYGLPKWYDDYKGMPFVQVFDVGEDFRLKPTTKRKISELAAQQSVFIPKGTLIITIQGSIGRVAITQYDAYIDRTLLLFEEFHKEIDITFFAYTLFLLFEIEKQKAPGGIIKTITKEVLSGFVVKLPSIEEQRKIASCLSSLDELISAQNEKIEALRQHKNGLLQGLFPNINEVTV